MKKFKFIISLAFTLGLIYFLSIPITVDKAAKTTVPPLGSFFSPFTGFWQNAESARNTVSEKLEIPGMKGKVKVIFDERLVPHIFAENLEDAYFAQGYILAKYRLWQMDLLSRVPSGRLAEVLGENLLKTDKLQRRKGMLHGAKNAAKAWQKSPEVTRLSQAYMDGANKYISSLDPKDIPLEFKLLDYRPEKWSMLKGALVKQYMSQTLCFRQEDIEATNTLNLLGKELFNKLYPEVNPKESPIIPAGTKWDFTPEKIEKNKAPEEAIGLIKNKLFEQDNEFVGSNNWAVAGSKTASGHPILCNDPHLNLSLPSIWFEMQIHTPESNVYGVAIPGLPGVVIGFNEHMAWGATNVGHDVADWYKIDWTDGAKTSYQIDGKVKKVKTVIEKYHVKGSGTPVFDTVKWTDWGPIVYESEENGWKDLALHWLAHDEPNPKDALAFQGLDMGKNYDDYRAALKEHSFPAQNFAFADVDGDIAITVNGWLPIKEKGQGKFVQDGSSSANGWKGFIPMDQVPHIKNPARGFISSANQRSTDSLYPYYYNSPGFEPYRGRYLNMALEKMEQITVEDMMRLQNSNYSLKAAETLPVLLSKINTKTLADKQLVIFNKMKKWDFNYDREKIEPAIFEAWWSNFYKMTFDEILPLRDSLDILAPDSWRLADLLSDTPEDPIFDDKKTPEKEIAGDIATISFLKTCDEMADKLVDPSFNWAAQNGTSIMHMARIPAFSKMNLYVSGTRRALNATSKFHGPSWRMVVDLGKEVKAWGVFPGGQSGNPGSPYYATGIEKWSNGEYNELFFMKNENDERGRTLFTIDFN